MKPVILRVSIAEKIPSIRMIRVHGYMPGKARPVSMNTDVIILLLAGHPVEFYQK